MATVASPCLAQWYNEHSIRWTSQASFLSHCHPWVSHCHSCADRRQCISLRAPKFIASVEKEKAHTAQYKRVRNWYLQWQPRRMQEQWIIPWYIFWRIVFRSVATPRKPPKQIPVLPQMKGVWQLKNSRCGDTNVKPCGNRSTGSIWFSLSEPSERWLTKTAVAQNEIENTKICEWYWTGF